MYILVVFVFKSKSDFILPYIPNLVILKRKPVFIFSMKGNIS